MVLVLFVIEGCKQGEPVNNIVVSPMWKYNMQKCVDASPLVVRDGSESFFYVHSDYNLVYCYSLHN